MFRKTKLLSMNNLIINPQFIRSQQIHRKRRLHRIELQEDRGEHCIEDQRERRSHLATSYGLMTHKYRGFNHSPCDK